MSIWKAVVCSLVVVSGPSYLQAQITFVDRGPEANVDLTSFGRGAALVDLDGDGLPDIVAANDGMPNFFFRQRPDHTFEDATAAWGIAFDERSSWGVLATDFDNDGDPDLYFISGGFPGQFNQLLRNDLNTTGVFTDVSAQSGDGTAFNRNFGGTTLDYDRDGDLDIFLTSPSSAPCVLLENNGNLFFTDVSSEAGLTHVGKYRHCSMGDYNNDGWMDVAVGNYTGPNRLYRNNGNGTFTDTAVAAGVQTPDFNFGLVLEDFDNDGWQDLFVPKYLLDEPGTSRVYRNNGDGTFADVTAGSGMTGQTDMGHNTGDLDDDGYPDVFIGTGNPAFADDARLFLMTPDGAGGLIGLDYSAASGITSSGLVRTHGIAMGDYDLDGDVDVYVNNGGPPLVPTTSEQNFLWQSQGNGRAWASLRLTGVISNRSAVGARCVAITESGRRVHRILRAGNGFANTDSPIQRFGIGDDELIDRIDITWPSGATQTVHHPPMMTVTPVIEGEDACSSDTNGDGMVDIDDVVNIILDFGTDGAAHDGDVDGSGLVDIDDVILAVLNFGPC